MVTRAARDAEVLASLLRERGATPIVAPTIEIAPSDDATLANRIAQNAEDYDWIVFTARPGIDAFFRARRTGSNLPIERAKIAVIGSASARRLEECGCRPDLVSPRATGDDLALALLERTRAGDRILIYGAHDMSPALARMLASHGRVPTVVAAYRTRTANDPDFARKVERADVVTFTSGSTTRGFTALLGGETAARHALRGKVVACIGPVTAQQLRAIGVRADVVASEFNAEGLVAAIESHFECSHN